MDNSTNTTIYTSIDFFNAIANGQFSKVQNMIKDGMHVNISDNLGFTPLMCAARYNQLTITHFLIQEGADIFKSTKRNSTALKIAANSGNFDIVFRIFLELDLEQMEEYFLQNPIKNKWETLINEFKNIKAACDQKLTQLVRESTLYESDHESDSHDTIEEMDFSIQMLRFKLLNNENNDFPRWYTYYAFGNKDKKGLLELNLEKYINHGKGPIETPASFNEDAPKKPIIYSRKTYPCTHIVSVNNKSGKITNIEEVSPDCNYNITDKFKNLKI